MYIACTCDGGSWGVNVCWACFHSDSNSETRKVEINSPAIAAIKTDENFDLANSEIGPLLLEDLQAEWLEEALAVQRAENDDGSYYVEERWDNMEEFGRSLDSGWPYSDDD